MLGTSPVIAFLATSHPDRARTFYSETIGLRLVADEPFAIVFDAHGTMLRIQKADSVAVAPYTALGWRVADMRSAVAGLRERGVTMERYGFLEQDADGIWKAPGGAKIAWFKDPDGHTLSLTEFGS
jgi:catechol 2,3-dioxygenase-like lactoylglutathione lyase family enzyme